MDQTQAFLTLLANPEGWSGDSYYDAFCNAYYVGDHDAVAQLSDLQANLTKALDQILRDRDCL